MKQRLNSEATEPLRHKAGNHAPEERLPGVNFEELNFEQRRAPYNSGNRILTDTEHDRPNRNGEEYSPEN